MHVIRLFAKLIRAARQTLRRLVLRFSVDRPAGLPVTGAIRYGLSRWDGLTRFLDDGRIEMDTNSVERAMRPIALNRKNSLFAGHDEGAVNWACLASLIETAKIKASTLRLIWPTSSPSSSTAGLCKNSMSYCRGPGPNSRLPIPWLHEAAGLQL